MNKFDYRWFGVAALGVYALGSLINLVPHTDLQQVEARAVLALVMSSTAGVLAAIWVAMYWRASRTRLSVVALIALAIILLCSIPPLLTLVDASFNQSYK